MSEKKCSRDCEHFNGWDGITELWTDCDVHGMFKGVKEDCEDFNKKLSCRDLLRQKDKRIRELEEQLQKFPPKIREIWLGDG